MSEPPEPLIPNSFLRPDADVTALVSKRGKVLACVFRSDFECLLSPRAVVGARLSDLFDPVPIEVSRQLARTATGRPNWAPVRLSTRTRLGTVQRRFVVAFIPWKQIAGEPVVLVRMRLITDELKDVAGDLNGKAGALDQRLAHLFSADTSLDDLYIDALVDLTMRETGFDIAVQLDEQGVILDFFDIARTDVSARFPVGFNYLDFMGGRDPGFRERWAWVLENSDYFNSFETLPTVDGRLARVVSRIRVTGVKTSGGLRVLQSFVKHIEYV